jgi:hypothetical protein
MYDHHQHIDTWVPFHLTMQWRDIELNAIWMFLVMVALGGV